MRFRPFSTPRGCANCVGVSAAKKKIFLREFGFSRQCVLIVHPGKVHTSQASSEQGWTYRMFYLRFL